MRLRRSKASKETEGALFAPNSTDNSPSKWESLAATPFVEAAISIAIGFFFVLLDRRQLAEITWVVGAALSFTRFAFSKKLEQELASVDRLAKIVDFQLEVPTEQFQALFRTYLQITEPEFVKVKHTIVTDALEGLTRLAHDKRSEELATSDYYNWLLPILESTSHGSSVWAVSMMFAAEWDDSPAESEFLRLTLDAVERGVSIERVFVAPKADIASMSRNPAVRAQLEKAGAFMKPLIAEREVLESRDPRLLKRLGDGMIGFDNRVAMVDVFSSDGQVRGYVTMNDGEISRLRLDFERLKVHAKRLNEVLRESADAQGGIAVLKYGEQATVPKDSPLDAREAQRRSDARR
jgi:hypothetical protein